MPFLAALMSGLGIFARVAIGSMIAKILIVLGVGIGSSLVIGPLLNDMLNQSKDAMLAIPSPFSDYLALARVDAGMAIIAGAALARAQLASLKLIATGVS